MATFTTLAAPAYLDPDQPPSIRVDDLISRMTLEEKVKQLLSVAPAIPRLQVPAYNYWSEALHGIGNDGVATVFPQAIGFAASWNAPLVHQMADAISTEGRARYQEALRQGRRVQSEGLTFWSPNINIFRDPRWGRGQETYGEDPFLTGRLAVAFITGLQGDDPQYLKAVATPKHFAVHSGPEPSRHSIDVLISRHDLQDTYLPAFRAAVREGHAASVMCSYNLVNGQPACANSILLEDTLRGAWGFDGYVVSDCQAITDFVESNKYSVTLEAAAAVSLRRGTDMDCDFSQSEWRGYLDAVGRGDLSEADIDRSLRRVYATRLRLGMFDPQGMVKYAAVPISENDSASHRALALNVARQSMVLLKNNGILPLRHGVRRLLVVGPLADSAAALLGNYSGLPSAMSVVIDGLRRQFTDVKIDYVPGTSFLRSYFPMPREAFGASAAIGTAQGGLRAQYYRSRDLSGAAETRVDARLSFGFNFDRLPEWAESDGYTARWSGTLVAPAAGAYSVRIVGTGGVRAWIDGRRVIDDWHEGGAPDVARRTFDLTFFDHETHAIKVEYLRFEQIKTLELHRRLSAGVQLVWKRWGGESKDAAVAAAAEADVVIAVVGITSELENEERSDDGLPEGFKGGDRTTLELPRPEQELLEAVKFTGKPLVLVLMNGSALAVNWAAKNADAILEAWYPGEEGGTAVAQTLAGRNNPAGRLPVTFYRSAADLPSFDDYRMMGRTYRYFTGPVLYPFGFGLSYSHFAYSGLQLAGEKIVAGEPTGVDCVVRNDSSVDGDEVVELYLDLPGRDGAPVRALHGFERVPLRAGESKAIHFDLSPRDLSFVTPAGVRMVSAGPVELFVGGGQPGSDNEGIHGSLLIVGDKQLTN
jgi:beta-glucosidase